MKGGMMVSKKIYLLTLAVFGLVMATVIGVKTVKAVENTNQGTSPIIQTLVKKFNLNQNEVANTIDEVRQEHHNQRQTQMENKLTKAVSDGVITEAQKQAILQKQNEMQTAREKERQETQHWMTDNTLDFSKLSQYGIGMGFGGREDGFGGRHFGEF